MISEQQKYFSGVLRNLGFAMLTPFGSIIFQWVVFEKGAYFEHFAHSVLIFLIGWVFIIGGYIWVREKNK